VNWFDNPQMRVALIWAAVGALTTLGAIVPFFVMDGMNGGYALSCGFGFLTLLFGVGTLMYLYRAYTLGKILGGEELVARWTYSPEEWARYAEAEHGRDRAGKIVLFFIISGFALFFGILFLIFGGRPGLMVFLAMLGLVALMGGVAFLSIHLSYRANKARTGEVFIARTGVYLNRALHNWNMFGASLDDVRLIREESPLVEFVYSYPARHGRQGAEVRVPVPAGKEEEAERVVGLFTGGLPMERE
jgi:hypothetical protein